MYGVNGWVLDKAAPQCYNDALLQDMMCEMLWADVNKYLLKLKMSQYEVFRGRDGAMYGAVMVWDGDKRKALTWQKVKRIGGGKKKPRRQWAA